MVFGVQFTLQTGRWASIKESEEIKNKPAQCFARSGILKKRRPINRNCWYEVIQR
jgi:hypothetical protein